MTEERLRQAMHRLDRALARVEAVAARRPDPALANLQRRHDVLRARTQDAIGALDRLIGS